ncbi:zinc finger protein 501-like [Episyrphus balteatus]|uniref:zinc finger protein 501-like n=1 Tax=Episyrphus balteatus TaxID=286459 RepID=UPI002486B9AF|nr:zinc finger protein 501-like [Episyrphus balteatus]
MESFSVSSMLVPLIDSGMGEDSDEWTDTDSNKSIERNGDDLTSSRDPFEDVFNSEDPLNVNDNKTIDLTNDRDALSPLTYLEDGQSPKEQDDFEFDFQTIDEAEQTEHILKVRVHANFCMRCGTGFVQQKTLNIHLEKNECSANTNSTEMPLTCSICGQSFFGIKCLRHHFMRHAQTRPFKCKNCPLSFVTQRDLYSHYRSHKDYRPFICDLCPKAYHSSKDLLAHKRNHVVEHAYGCRLCPRRFKKSKYLAAHKRKHDAKKPFKCKFCRRSYAQNSLRNMHMRTHTISKKGLLKFLCEICGLTHVRSRSVWAKLMPTTERRQSNDSNICLGDNSKEDPRPWSKNRRRKSSESSDSVQIIEDPLQFTIDLVDE